MRIPIRTLVLFAASFVLIVGIGGFFVLRNRMVGAVASNSYIVEKDSTGELTRAVVESDLWQAYFRQCESSRGREAPFVRFRAMPATTGKGLLLEAQGTGFTVTVDTSTMGRLDGVLRRWGANALEEFMDVSGSGGGNGRG